MSDQAAPGWYPVDERTERWWDGTQWSEHQRPLGQGAQEAQPAAGDAPGAQDATDRSGATGAPAVPAPASPGTPYPYGGDQLPGSNAGTYGVPAPGQPPQASGPYGQAAPAYGQAPVYGQPPAKRSTGRTVAAVVVGIIAFLFTLAAFNQIANNTSGGSRGFGYVIGSLLIPAALWVGFYFLIRKPKS